MSKVSIPTIGQYLRASDAHAPMSRYDPDEFADLEREALARGFVRTRGVRYAPATAAKGFSSALGP